VESIHPESPAAQLGLVAGADYIVQANGGAFSMESELPTDPAETPAFIGLVRKFQDKPLKISIYSSTTLKDRVVTIKPSRKWPGGETKGLLGMKVKFMGASLPVPSLRSEPVPSLSGQKGGDGKSGKGQGAKEEKAGKEDGGGESDSSSGSDSDDCGGGGAEGGTDGPQVAAEEAEKKEEEGLSSEELAVLKEKRKKDKKFAKKREMARVKAAKQKADKADKEQRALKEATSVVEARENAKREALERKREEWERGVMEMHDDVERFLVQVLVPVPVLAAEEEDGEGLWPPGPSCSGAGDDGTGSVGTHSQPGSLEVSEGKVSIFKGDPEQEAALKFAHHEVFETCRHGDLDGLKAVLADAPECMEYSDFGGCTPLLLACMRRHISCAEFLISEVFIVEATCARLP
jgi:hypothetical protein